MALWFKKGILSGQVRAENFRIVDIEIDA